MPSPSIVSVRTNPLFTERIGQLQNWLIYDISVNRAGLSGGLYFADEGTYYFDLLAHWNLTEDYLKVARRIPINSPEGKVMSTRDPTFFNMDQKFPENGKPYRRRMTLHALGFVPLKFQNHVFGCIKMACDHDRMPFNLKAWLMQLGEAVEHQTNDLCTEILSQANTG